MDFTEATAALEREFGAQHKAGEKVDLTIAVVSGGTVNTVLDPAPALCFTRELAVKFWLSAARAVLDGEDHLKSWAMSQPVVDTWNMTLADKKNTHRVVAKRYSASAVLTIKLKSRAEIENEEAAEARRRDAAIPLSPAPTPEEVAAAETLAESCKVTLEPAPTTTTWTDAGGYENLTFTDPDGSTETLTSSKRADDKENT
jgi:hypothetical protein